MTDALTRAARAIMAALDANFKTTPLVGRSVDSTDLARAAILSFLDGEDVVEACARALDDAEWAEAAEPILDVGDAAYNRHCVNAILAALRALVQEAQP